MEFDSITKYITAVLNERLLRCFFILIRVLFQSRVQCIFTRDAFPSSQPHIVLMFQCLWITS